MPCDQIPEKPYDVSIGIIYTFEETFINALLHSVPAACEGITAKVVLVDNNSAKPLDDPGKILQDVRLAVTRNPRKYYYSKNINVILKNSTDSRYCLVMNTDMAFLADDPCVSRMVRFMDENPGCGLSTCRLVGPEGQFMWPARKFQNLRIILARRFPRLFQDSKVVKDYLYADHSQTDAFPCDWVSGCFMMIRMKAFEKVGLFDEKYAKYFEDVDYCRRMHLHSWEVMYNGKTSCMHYEQRASINIFSASSLLHVLSYFRYLTKSYK
jgi:GT2 family glycosyltransferase